jgi:hypothetical protein
MSKSKNINVNAKDRFEKPGTEQFQTLKEVAANLGLPSFKVTRAAKAGLFPTYTLFNSRRLARLSEVIAAIDSSRTGGSDGTK